MAEVTDTVLQVFPECAVLLVDVEVIAFKKIVGHIDIRIAVIVDIPNGHAQAEADEAAVDICLFTDICELAVVIAQKPVTPALQEIRHRPVPGAEVPLVGVV